MRYTCFRLVAIWSVLALVTFAEPLPGPDAIWAYLPFDGDASAVVPAGGFRGVTVNGAPMAMFEAGVAGQALSVTAGRGRLNFAPGVPDFPLAEGSLLLWIKPSRPTDHNGWLVAGSWASFDLAISSGRILAYATGNAQHFVSGSLREVQDSWPDRWHLIVLTWQGDRRVVYVDGQLAGERAGVEPLKQAPYTLSPGYLPGGGGRPDGGWLEGAMDDLAIMKVALTPAQVASLDAAARQPGYTGLLQSLGGAAFVTMPRHAWIRGEMAAAKLHVFAPGTGAIALAAVPAAGGGAVPLASLGAGERELSFATALLRPGRYVLQATVERAGQPSLVSAGAPLTVLAERRPAFPLGIDGLLGYDDATLAEVASWGINHVSGGGYNDLAIRRDVDRLYQHGLGFFPSLNIHYHKWMPLPGDGWYNEQGTFTQKLADEVLQVLVLDGDTTYQRYSSSIGSPFSAVGREAMRQRLRSLLDAAGDHPGLQFLSFDDEYVLRMGRDQASGKLYLGDYSPSARRVFKEKSGRDPVFPPAEPPGTIFPDDHPYFAWRDVIGMPHDATSAGLESSWADLRETVRAVRPDLLVTTWSGGGYGYLDAVMDYWYPTIWQPHPGFEVGHGRQDYVFDYHRATQRVTPRQPVWGLIGWWSDNLAGKPAWCVADFRLNTSMALAKGCKLITWFTAYGPRNPETGGAGILSRPDLRDEAIRWAGWIRRFGPMYAQLAWRPAGRVAVLWSEDNRAGQVHRGGSPNHPNTFYAALRLAGVAPDVIADHDVKAGRLADYQALILLCQEYASASLWQAIERFAATPGKTVFVDQGCKLRPAGAIELDFDAFSHAELAGRSWGLPIVLETMAAQADRLRPLLAGKVTSDNVHVSGSALVAPFWLYGGDGRLLTLANYDVFGEQAALATIPVAPGSALYDLAAGRLAVPLAAPGQPLRWPVKLAAGDSAVALLLPRPIGEPVLDFAVDADRFRVRLVNRDAGRQPLAAVLPWQLTFLAPDGTEVAAYARYLSTGPDGRAEIAFLRSLSMDAAGRWTVVATCLADGKSHRATAVLP